MGEFNDTPEPESKFARDARETLMQASLVLSSFRWKLQKAGYPFCEPPGVTAMLRDIDALCFPEPEKQNKKQGKAKAAA